MAGDHHALDERVRVGEEQRDVLAGARLRLVGVDDEVVRLAVALRDELPLHPGGEAGAAAAAQPGVLHVGDDVVRGHGQRLAQALVALVPAVGLQRPGLRARPRRRTGRARAASRAGLLDVVCCHGHHSPSSAPVRRGARGRTRRSAAVRRASWGARRAPPRRRSRRAGGRRRTARRAGRPSARRGLAAGQPQPGERGGAGAAGGLDGAGALVGEAGEDAGGLLEGAQRRAAGGSAPRGRRAGRRRAALADSRRLVVEELPVDHHHGGEVAGRVALDVLQRDLAVLGGLVVADARGAP